MNYQIVDNFLPEENLKALQEQFIWNPKAKWNMIKKVAGGETDIDTQSEEPWYWYASNCIWDVREIMDESWDVIDKNLIQPMIQKGIINQLTRAKANFYPSWHELKEHAPHFDYDFYNIACVYSLNTCDGFTRLGQDTTVSSVENRAIFFDGTKLHNSTNCTTPSGRFNINLNFI